MQTKHIQKYIFLIYVLLYCIPMGMSCFQIKDSLMFNIAIWPAFVLLLIEAIQLREQGLQYFMGWNLIDAAQLAVFGILYYMRYMGEDRSVLYFPELKLVNIILTFLKLLFFVRIFEDYGFLVQMIILCMQDLVPFFMTYLLFLNFFSMCFVVLNCDIDGEIESTPILSGYELMLLQVYRTALGELSMPGYKNKEIWRNGKSDDIFLHINIIMIWILWVVSTFFMFVIMTNFNIAQITSTYERVRGLEKKISYELKAEMNHETYMLLAIFTTLPSYRCIVFANTKNSQGKQTELLDDQFDQLKKSIMKNNQAFDGKNEEHMRKLKKVSDQQNNLKHFFKDKMMELMKRQEAMKMTLLEDVRKKLGA